MSNYVNFDRKHTKKLALTGLSGVVYFPTDSNSVILDGDIRGELNGFDITRVSDEGDYSLAQHAFYVNNGDPCVVVKTGNPYFKYYMLHNYTDYPCVLYNKNLTKILKVDSKLRSSPIYLSLFTFINVDNVEEVANNYLLTDNDEYYVSDVKKEEFDSSSNYEYVQISPNPVYNTYQYVFYAETTFDASYKYIYSCGNNKYLGEITSSHSAYLDNFCGDFFSLEDNVKLNLSKTYYYSHNKESHINISDLNGPLSIIKSPFEGFLYLEINDELDDNSIDIYIYDSNGDFVAKLSKALYSSEGRMFDASDDFDYLACAYYQEQSNTDPIQLISKNKSTGTASIAEGLHTTSSGWASHAEGYSTIASANSSHAEGCLTTASAYCSHAESCGNKAAGNYSHAEGYYTLAQSSGSHSEGYNLTSNTDKFFATGQGAHVEGSAHSNSFAHYASGEGAHLEGYTAAYGQSIASGIGSHAEGYTTQASGLGSHAEGGYTISSNSYSHAEGSNSRSSGYASHSEGYSTIASEYCSHAEGYNTSATALYTHAEGIGTAALGSYQHVLGKYNLTDSRGKYADIIGGGGNTTARKNIETVDWDGNLWTFTDVMCGGSDLNNAVHKLSLKLNASDSPTKLSDLENDAGFIEEETDPVFTASPAAGITSADITKWNSAPTALVQSDWNQTDTSKDDYIKNKPTNLSLFTNDSGFLTEHQSLDFITEKIPTQATSENQLADKAFVNSSVLTSTANFRGAWPNYGDVPTNESYYPEDFLGYKTPTVNDYLVVEDASDYNEPSNESIILNYLPNYTLVVTYNGVIKTYYYTEMNLTYINVCDWLQAKYNPGAPGWYFIKASCNFSINNIEYLANTDYKLFSTNSYQETQLIAVLPANLSGTWRFKYTGLWATSGKTGWKPEYRVNEEPLTAAQVAALNSGVTADIVASIPTKTSLLTNDSGFLTSHLDISGKADDSKVVHLAGAETITGSKTFSSPIIESTSLTGTSAQGLLGVTTTANSLYMFGLTTMAPNMGAGTGMFWSLGKEPAQYNKVSFGYSYAGSGSTNNSFSISFYGQSGATNSLNIYPDRIVSPYYILGSTFKKTDGTEVSYEGHTHDHTAISDWSTATASFLTSHQDISGKQDISTLETDVKAFINADYVKSLIEDGTEVSY